MIQRGERIRVGFVQQIIQFVRRTMLDRCANICLCFEQESLKFTRRMEGFRFAGRVQIRAADGNRRKIRAANVEELLRIIQSIPSPKAEPFKGWLARVGCERLEKIENPELAARRMREIYRAMGFTF